MVDGQGVAHFLFADGTAARKALEAAGIRVLEERDVLVQRLKQDVPGQLGMLTRRMAEAGVNIEVLYGDHDHQLVLVVDDLARGARFLKHGVARLDSEVVEWSRSANRPVRGYAGRAAHS